MSLIDFSSSRKSNLVRVCLFGTTYFAGAALGHYLAFPNAAYWPFWPPNGLFLGVLLVSPRRLWPALWAATLPTSLVADLFVDGFRAELLLLAIGFWLGNTLEGLLAAWLIQKLTHEPVTLANTREFLILVVVGAILTPAVGATIGAIAIKTSQPDLPFFDYWLQWWIGDAVGVLVVSPVVITWSSASGSPRVQRNRGGYILEFVAYCLAVLIVTENVFHRIPEENSLAARFPFFILMPFLLWAGFRFEPRGASLSILLLALIIIWCTTRGYGSIARYGEGVMQQGLLLQGLLAEASCLILLFSSSIERRELAEMRLQQESKILAKTEGEVRQQRDLLQSILDSMGEAVIVVDVAGNFVQFNPAARKMHRLGAESHAPEIRLQAYNLYLADGVTPCPIDQEPVRRALRGEICDGVPLVIRPMDGSPPVYARASARPIRAADGTITGAVVVRSDITPLVLAEKEQATLINQLQQALSEIKTLHGLIPICANCKKIRNDQGAWERLESYMSAHTDAEFTHGVCPECCPLLFGENWQQSMEDTVT